MSLLLEAYDKLPRQRANDDPIFWQAAIEDAMQEFLIEVRGRYNEGTLTRILETCTHNRTRQAAALALGMYGSWECNNILAAALRGDECEKVREFCADAMWNVWFRGTDETQARELRQAMGLPDSAQQLAALDDIIARHPEFSEAYNQRAVLWFRRAQYIKAVNDCEMALRLNPHHFGAASGMGQCYMRMNRPHAALTAFARALEMHPGLPDIQQTIDSLRATIREE